MTGLKYDATGDAICDGMLIAPKYVLSVAHCPRFAYVQVGSHYRINGTDGEVIPIVKRLRHPTFNYTISTPGYDYQIFELETESSFTPVPILSENPTVAPFTGKFATTMGWGSTNVDDYKSFSNVLLRVDLQLRSMDECAALGMKPLDESMICAGGVEGQDTCNGDSGGPLFLETSKGDALIGITSWGKGCARKNRPGVYARLSTVLDWIKENAPGATFVAYPDS